VNRAWQIGEGLTATLEDETREELARDPFREVADAFGLQVKLVAAGGGDEECSCDGTLDRDGGTITVAETVFSRRSAFTCLHELGHFLLWREGQLLSQLYELHPASGGRVAEEKACDAFAAEILVPRTLAEEITSNRRVGAEQFIELYARSRASREACAVRLAQLLGCEGHVMLARPDGTAVFTASAGPYIVARGVRQGDDHITVAAGRTGGARRETHVRFRSGRTKPMWGDARRDGQFVYAVLADVPRWPVEGATILRQAHDRAEPVEVQCSSCGHDFQTFDSPCRQCGIHRCPQCGRCGCPSGVVEKTCGRCFLIKPARLFPDDGSICRDCL
jgi:Zn-dependent peptidase ImmA (M78 family)